MTVLENDVRDPVVVKDEAVDMSELAPIDATDRARAPELGLTLRYLVIRESNAGIEVADEVTESGCLEAGHREHVFDADVRARVRWRALVESQICEVPDRLEGGKLLHRAGERHVRAVAREVDDIDRHAADLLVARLHDDVREVPINGIDHHVGDLSDHRGPAAHVSTEHDVGRLHRTSLDGVQFSRFPRTG